MKRAISRVHVVFSGLMTARYNDKKAEHPEKEGYWTYRRRSAKDPNKPEPVFLDTWQKRKAFLKAEKLIGYEDVGPIEPMKDGRHSRSRVGLPGSWV